MATKNGFRRLTTILTTVAALVATAVPAIAGQNWMPLLPDQDFYDFQMFAPPESQDYAIRQDAREGIFFTYDRTFWAFTPAQSRPILNDFFIPVQPLSPVAVAQLNNNLIQAGYPGSGLFVFGSDPLRLDLNTNWMRTVMSWGNRFEGGWIYDDYGMMFTYYNSGPQSQNFVTTNSFAVNSPTTTFWRRRPGRRWPADRRDHHHVREPAPGPHHHANADPEEHHRTDIGGLRLGDPSEPLVGRLRGTPHGEVHVWATVSPGGRPIQH